MIFGRTYAEREELQGQIRRWHMSFAWLPHTLVDGRWVWLEPVERRNTLWTIIQWEYRLPRIDKE